MSESFLKLIHLPEAVAAVLENLAGPVPRTETVGLEDALGRVVARDVVCPEDLPGFDRSSMDGYAVRAQDTFGASEGLPAYVELVGEILMGRACDVPVGSGQALRISTGGLMPEGADAVVMVENTELSGTTIEIVKSVAPGDNTVARDEDITEGALMVSAGRVLAPAHVGALAGVGILELEVFVPPTVGIISTGDELVAPTEKPHAGQVRDINSIALRAAARKAGAVPKLYGIVGDDAARLLDVTRAALAERDMVLISGGSSAGVRDVTLGVLETLGEPGLLAHGIYLKPGKPTLVAVCGGKPVIGLPGNPASALAVFQELVVPVLTMLRGELPRPGAFAARTVCATIDRSISSSAGRVELVPVSLQDSEKGLIASAVLGKASLIGTLVRAQGQVRIPLGSEGIEQGQEVIVELFE
ncbi:MAG: molybdopterin-binding protein [Candidatus Geothermincolia bacterium]